MSEIPRGRTAGQPDHVPALSQSLAELIAESQALRGDVKSAEQARRRGNGLIFGVLGVLILFVGMLCMVTWQNNQLVHKVDQTNATMADCTTPGGKCYQEGRVRTGEILADVIRAHIFVAQCARLWPNEAGESYDRKLKDCVYGRLAKAAQEREQQPSPSPSPGR